MKYGLCSLAWQSPFGGNDPAKFYDEVVRHFEKAKKFGFDIFEVAVENYGYDVDATIKAAKETGAIVTSEEHSIIGGLGGAVSEFLSGTCPVPVVRHGVEDSFGRSGTWSAVLEYYGVTPEGIAAKAKQAIALKK